jgi:hypothetical protein
MGETRASKQHETPENQRKENTTMKTRNPFTSHQLKLTVCVAILSASFAMPQVWAGPPKHSVTGSGVVNYDDYPELWSYPGSFRTTVAVHEDAGGNLVGSVHNTTDNPLGLGLRLTISSKPTCLVVVDDGPNGKKAWISSEITHVEVSGPDPVFAAFVQQLIESFGTLYTMVYDQGRNGEDVMHYEVMNVPCDSGPVTLAETVVRNGNFSIR